MADYQKYKTTFEQINKRNFAIEQFLAVMKKIILLVTLGMMLAAPSFANRTTDPAIPIPVIKTKPSSEGTHRTPEVIPITCMVDADAFSVYVTFLFNMGDVDIIMENQSTGEYILSTVDSSLGGAIIPGILS